MAEARRCDLCDKPYIAKNSRSRFCSDACRAKNGGHKRPAVPEQGNHTTDAAVEALEDAGRLSTPAGAAALVLARRIDSATDTGSALAALVREFRATMTEALAQSAVADSVDEMKARRDAKLRAATG